MKFAQFCKQASMQKQAWDLMNWKGYEQAAKNVNRGDRQADYTNTLTRNGLGIGTTLGSILGVGNVANKFLAHANNQEVAEGVQNLISQGKFREGLSLLKPQGGFGRLALKGALPFTVGGAALGLVGGKLLGMGTAPIIE